MTKNQIIDAPQPPAAQHAPKLKKPFILFEAFQWGVAIVFAVLVLATASDIGKLNVPGAPVALFWTALATVIGVTLIHSPPAFFRLPRIGKCVAYVGIVAGLGVYGSYAGQMKDAYSKTPEGAREAAAEAVREVKAKAQQAELDKAEKALADFDTAQAEADETAKKLAADTAKLKQCFSYFGNDIPKLTSQVQESLNNPASFEHVKTEQIDSNGYNVEMTFRGENSFSAIVTNNVRAKIDPADCSVVSIE